MAWATSAELLAYASQVLKVPEVDLPTLWTANATAAVQQGYLSLVGFLATPGYSGDQMTGSDQAQTFNLMQGLYCLAGLGGGFGDYPREWFDRFDVVGALSQRKGGWSLTQDGVPVAPDSTSEVGGIRHGTTSVVCQTARLLAQQAYGYYGSGGTQTRSCGYW